MPSITKSLVAAAVLALGLSAQAAQAQTVRLTTVLSGGNEAPDRILTGGTGTAEVFVDLATKSITYAIKIFNLPSGTRAGHFHVGGPGVAGPVVIDLTPPFDASNDYELNGTVTQSMFRARPEIGIRDMDDFIQSLVGGQAYLNIHTAVYGAGEIRGQLTVAP